jgi:hypothetical protein
VRAALERRLAGLVELGAGAAEPYQLACFAPGPASRGYVRHVDEPRCSRPVLSHTVSSAWLRAKSLRTSRGPRICRPCLWQSHTACAPVALPKLPVAVSSQAVAREPSIAESNAHG